MEQIVKWIADPTTLWWRIAMVPIYVGSIVLAAELGHRYWQLNPEQTRKIVHIGTGNVMLIAWLLNLPAWVGICSAVLAGATALVSYYLPILPGVNSVSRKSLGTFFYAVSIGVTIAIFWPKNQPYYATIGILIMAWGDGLAAIVGTRWGKHPYRIFGNRKSWEGTLTMFVVSYTIAAIILTSVIGISSIPFIAAFPIALLAITCESISQFGLDNLTVPIGCAILSSLAINWLS
jgi:phytol kinase